MDFSTDKKMISESVSSYSDLIILHRHRIHLDITVHN